MFFAVVRFRRSLKTPVKERRRRKTSRRIRLEPAHLHLFWFSPKSSLRRKLRHKFLPAVCRIHCASLKWTHDIFAFRPPSMKTISALYIQLSSSAPNSSLPPNACQPHQLLLRGRLANESSHITYSYACPEAFYDSQP